jgi:hypothetical protein
MAGLLLHMGTLMVCIFMLLLLALEQHSQTFLIFIFMWDMLLLLLLLNLWVRLLLLPLLNRLLLLLLLLLLLRLLLGLVRLQHQGLVCLPYVRWQGHVDGAVVAALGIITLLVIDTSSQINWSSTAQQINSAADMSDRRSRQSVEAQDKTDGTTGENGKPRLDHHGTLNGQHADGQCVSHMHQEPSSSPATHAILRCLCSMHTNSAQADHTCAACAALHVPHSPQKKMPFDLCARPTLPHHRLPFML